MTLARISHPLLKILLCAFCIASPGRAQEIVDTTDFGPFVTVTVDAPGGNLTMKGVVVRLGKDQDAAVCYDTDLLRCAAGWVGIGKGWKELMEYRSTSFSANHGQANVPKGEVKFGTTVGPGWAKPGGEDFTDPREPQPYQDNRKLGPLPAEWVDYKGLYLHGDKVVLSYTLGACEVLESPGLIEAGGDRAFTRTLRLGKSDQPMTLFAAFADTAASGVGKVGGEVTGENKGAADGGSAAVLVGKDGVHTAAAVVGAPAGAAWTIQDGRAHLTIPPHGEPVTFELVVWSGPKENLAKLASLLDAGKDVGNLPELCKGGPPRWTADIATAGTLGDGEQITDAATKNAAYVVDTLTLPYDNPYKAVMRACGMDFFSDGRIAVSIIGGDVWIVSGVDEKLASLKWKRFATGLYQPLGLKIVDDKVYTVGRDQITRLHDLNNDGEADFYENFNNDTCVTENYHEFCLDLQTDSAGNFYYGKGAPWTPEVKTKHQGSMLKVSKDGKTLEVFATGLRAPNGLGMGPNDLLTCSDNQGHWMPSSKVNRVQPGKFYGLMQAAHRDPPPTDFEKPILWLPVQVDNSSGGQAWAPPGEKWGPLAGHMLHTSYGSSRLFQVMTEEVDGVMQGAAVLMPLAFESSCMRARFSPHDSQLYLCGLKGWQTNGQKDGAVHRVRYTGKPTTMPTEFHAAKNGLFITFASPLDPTEAADAQNYAAERWNYKWTENYGSPEYSVTNPDQAGHDTVEIRSARVSPDGKMVFLEINDLGPADQMKINCNVKDAAGADVSWEIYSTINKVGPERKL